MIQWIRTAWDTYVLHSLRGNGYQWWSGSGSNWPVIGVLLGMWHRHNCHQSRCPRVVRHGHTHCPKHSER